VRDRYAGAVARLVRVAALSLVLTAGFFAGTWWLAQRTPSGFLPQEDQGAFFVEVVLPQGASLNRTAEVSRQVEDVLRGLPGVVDVITNAGYSMLNGLALSNTGFMIVTLKPFGERAAPELGVNALMAQVARQTSGVAAQVIPYNLPPIIGLGTSGGFEFQLQNLEGRPVGEMAAAMRALVLAANQDPRWRGSSRPSRRTRPRCSSTSTATARRCWGCRCRMCSPPCPRRRAGPM